MLFKLLLLALGLLVSIFGWGLKAVSRLDLPLGVDRFGFIPPYGHLFGIPTRSDTANLTTGVPTNGKAGWAPGAVFFNFLSSGAGTCLYVNTGSKTSTTWTNIA